MATDGGLLHGKAVVVTAGGTREPIDPVRFLGNRSSGKMGNALAHAARDAGARVHLITTVSAPADLTGITTEAVGTADQMNTAVHAALKPGSILIMAAAVADYRVESVAPDKIHKTEAGLTLHLVPTIDILKGLAHDPVREQVFIVGFAAETNDAIASGQSKVRAKNLDLCVINDVSIPGIGMGADDNAVTIVDKDGIVDEMARAPKDVVAREIIRVIASRLPART